MIFVGFFLMLAERQSIKLEKVELDNSEKRLPNVIILGVKKCGTVALATILGNHPNIATPKGVHIPFFAQDELYQKGADYLKSKMPAARKDQLVLAKSPTVFQSSNISLTLQRHVDLLPDVKVILVVKNPIDRVVSDILHTYDNGIQAGQKMPDINDIIMDRAGYIQANAFSDLTLSKAVILLSNYSMAYEHMTEVFPRDNMLFVNGQALVEDPLAEIKNVETFLKLASFFNDDHFVYPEKKEGFPCFKIGENAECLSKRKGRTHPPLAAKTMNFLKKQFQPMLDKFRKQTGIVFEL